MIIGRRSYRLRAPPLFGILRSVEKLKRPALILMLLFCRPARPGFFLCGLLLALAAEALRVWEAGAEPGSRESGSGPYAFAADPKALAGVLFLFAFALASTSFYFWVRSALIWTAALWWAKRYFEDQPPRFRGLPARLSAGWSSSRWSPQRAVASGEAKVIGWGFLLLLYLRFKMVYRL